MPTDTIESTKPAEVEMPPVIPIQKKPRRLNWKRMAAGLALIGLLGTGASYGVTSYEFATAHESTDDAFIDGDIVPISAKVSGTVEHLNVNDNQIVHKGDLLVEIEPSDYQARLAQADAQVEAARKVLATARIKVRVTDITSQGGVDSANAQVVQATSSVDQTRQSVTTAMAQVDTAQARLSQALAQALAARHNQEQAEAQIVAAQADETRLRQDLVRLRTLYAQNAIAKQDLDHGVNLHDAAVAQVEAARRKAASMASSVADAEAAVVSARDQIRLAQSQVGEAQARVAQAEAGVNDARGRLTSATVAPQQVALTQSDVAVEQANVKAAEAARHQAALNLQYTRIYAPWDGRITRRSVQTGANIQPTQVLFSIVRPEVWVTANFKETQLTHMHVGQRVVIHVDAYPQQMFHGHVDSLQQGSGARFSLLPPENATGNYVKVVQRVPVKIAIDDKLDPRFDLGPGMSVVPEVELQ